MFCAGLLTFIVVQILNMIGLLFDLWLCYCEYLTITEWVWKIPAIGIFIILVQLVGLGGLIVHFYGK